jgi:hypothetical protein
MAPRRFHVEYSHIGGVMGSVLALSAIDSGYEPRLSQTRL